MGISRDSEDQVIGADSANNVFVQEVIGNKDDTRAGTSLMAKTKEGVDMARGHEQAGNKWFVSRNITASGDGKTWRTAFKTLGEAIAQVNADYIAAVQPDKGRNAWIFVGEGWYGEIPLVLTANDVHIMGVAPGNHDSIVLYGSNTPGGFNIGAGGPALTIRGHNNTIENIGFFTHDVLYAALQIGIPGAGNMVVGNYIKNCSFVRDVFHGQLYGIRSYDADGLKIEGCFFSTSCLTAGIWIGTNGVINPVNGKIIGCTFIGTETGIIIGPSAHTTLIKDNIFVDDTSDRDDAITLPVDNTGGVNTIYIGNYAEFTEGNQMTGGDSLRIGNQQLA